MMNTLEREVIEKFLQLDKDAQKRVRERIEKAIDSAQESETSAFDYDAWFRDVKAMQQEIRAGHGGKLPPMDVVEMLRDIRDGEDE